MPQFSIIIPCFNQAHFLNDALQSLLLQSYTDWEAIIVNDGSPDDTSVVANVWVKRDSRFRLVEQNNAGLSAARNTGISEAKGNYIGLLDADDRYGPHFLQTVFLHFEQGFEMVCCGYTYFNSKGTINKVVRQSKQLDFKSILTGNRFPPVALAFQRQVLDRTGMFDSELKSAEDWDLWIRMFKAGVKLSVIEDSLVYYRISDNSMSRQPFTMYAALKNVALRACQKDQRLVFSVSTGEEAYHELPETIKVMLLMCMGVAVMQGKIETAVDLVRHEANQFNLLFNDNDFQNMSSYLSFRYRTSSEDLKYIKNDLMPLFNEFIDLLNFEYLNREQVVHNIFKKHKKLMLRKRFGLYFSFL